MCTLLAPAVSRSYSSNYFLFVSLFIFVFDFAEGHEELPAPWSLHWRHMSAGDSVDKSSATRLFIQQLCSG